MRTPVANESRLICFEQPLSERTRTLLRLECLLDQSRHHLQDECVNGRRAAVANLLEVLTLLSRSDLKTELLKELGDRHLMLSRLQNRPGVDHARLTQILRELEQLSEHLQEVPAQSANVLLKESDFLTGVLNRSGISGGTCGFDLPSYHRWLQQPPETQRHDIDRWRREILPFEAAITLLLRLLRESATPVQKRAEGGVYVHVMEGPCQLIRVLLPADTSLYPEISAGKHRCTIRFMEHGDVSQRAAQSGDDVGFQLMLCSL